MKEERRSDMTGRIVVAAGIFLCLFFMGHFLKNPIQAQVKDWIGESGWSDQLIEKTADWLMEREKAI